MEDVSQEQLDKIYRRIQAMLEKAASTDFDEERKTFTAQANALAHKYRVDLAMLGKKEHKARKPESRDYMTDSSYEFAAQATEMQLNVFRHFGCKVYERYDRLVAVGFAHNLALAEMMWTSIHMHFIGTLLPEWDTKKPFNWNVFQIKSSGRTWAQIVTMAPEDHGLTMQSGPRLQRAYKIEAKRRGITPPQRHSQRPAAYRLTFAESYATVIGQRLRAAKKDDDEQDSGNQAGAIALRDEDAIILEEFYQLFPHMRPRTPEERAESNRLWYAARQKEAEAENSRRAGLTDKQRQKEDEAKERERLKRDRRWAREDVRNRPDELGWRMGHDAGQNADLGGDSKVGTRSAGELH